MLGRDFGVLGWTLPVEVGAAVGQVEEGAKRFEKKICKVNG